MDGVSKDNIDKLKKAGSDLLGEEVLYPDSVTGLPTKLEPQDGSKTPTNADALKTYVLIYTRVKYIL